MASGDPREALAISDQTLENYNQISIDKAEALKEKAGGIHVSHLLPGERQGVLGQHLSLSISCYENDCDLWISSFFEEKQQQMFLERIKTICRNQPSENPVYLTLKYLSHQREPRVFFKDIIDHLVQCENWLAVKRLHDYVYDPCSSFSTDNLPPVSDVLPDIDLSLRIHEKALPHSREKFPTSKRERLKGLVLLTYAHDGAMIAKELKSFLMKPSRSGRWYDVFTLADLVLENVYDDIPYVLRNVNFVVPILTPGYMQLLESKRFDCLEQDIDVQYAPLIHTMLCKEYTTYNRLKNKRVRCFVPEVGRSIPYSPALKHDLVLNVYNSDFKGLRKYLV